MSGSFFKPFYVIFIFLFIFIIFFTCFFGSFVSQSSSDDQYFVFDMDSEYLWPSPGYTTINSYFGKRSSPTAGASTFHKGIDIGAPQGSNLVAICDGKITFTGFLGGGGYTITLTVNDLKITYCHVSPQYIVKVGDIVQKGDIIGHVGPKNVYGVPR